MTGDFEITVFPTVVVTDPRGRPFGVMSDYKLNGVTAFLMLMDKWDHDGKTLFDLLEKSKTSNSSDLINKTLDFLELNELDRFYGKTVKDLSQKLPGGGQREVTEEEAKSWLVRFAEAHLNPDNAKKEVEEFDRWKTKHSFKKHADIGAHAPRLRRRCLRRLVRRRQPRKSATRPRHSRRKAPTSVTCLPWLSKP